MQLFDLPPGWKSVPMWSVAARKDRKGYSDAELLSVYREYGVIRKSDRDDNHNVESEDLSNYKFVRKGDLVLNKMKTWQGSLGVSPYEGIVSPAYYVCELSKDLHAPYIHYLLRSAPYIAMYGARSKGIRIGQWDLPYEEFREIPVLVPPIEEQRRISDYLDSQLHSVRMMISKKEALSASLSQERLTKISSLVTSGSCDSRDSFGFDIDDWIEFKSKEWKLLPLKHLVSLDNSGVWGEDPGVLDIDVPVATTAHLTRTNTFLFEQMPIRSLTLKDFRKYVCNSGDLIVVKSSGSSDNIMSGKVCVVGDDATKFAFSNFLMRLRPHDASLSRFLQAFLSSHVGVERVKRMVSVTTYPNLRVEEYMNSLIPVPPENEIRQLNETIECIEKRYSAIIEKIHQSLENLRQYESALISELVTGSKSVPNKREEVNV